VSKGRLEAFSDGVIAIIITIMVLELRPPEEPTFEALLALWPVFFSYALSFMSVGIYWMNHHHLLQSVKVVDGRTLIANLGFLFWLSLVPFGTAWMGENEFASAPVALYGAILMLAGIGYFVLEHVLARIQPEGTALLVGVTSRRKEQLSLTAYVVSIPVAFVAPLVSVGLIVAVAVLWFIPDRRLERQVAR
jgi:uncharacterized membrane protein